jgi:hypothetical protein
MKPVISITIPTSTTSSTSGKLPHGAAGRSSSIDRLRRASAAGFGFGVGAAGCGPAARRGRRLRRFLLS